MTQHPVSASPIHIDIVSDIVCPWCWLGARYFVDARSQFETATSRTVKVAWRPFMLDPTVPEAGVPYRDYMRAKFGPSDQGSSDRFKVMRAHLEAAAPDAGIQFNFDAIPMRPNSMNAHRVIRWATGQNKGEAASEVLFRTFFKDLKDVGDPDVLSDVADEIGLDGTLTRDLLETDRDKDALQKEMDYYRNQGISGVPTFIYNGQFALQGAQPMETHLKALEKAASLSSTRYSNA